jgi:peptidoglycan/xylan/chitin deacetylase (PgdA/CDA1 family)
MISVMFHSAGLNNLGWRSSLVSEPLDIMRDKFEVIRKQGWRTIFMREAAEHLGSKRDALVHLNFDDGYLDNWVHIFPLLERHGFKATIYATADFVDPRDILRERRVLFEREHDAADCCAGFLSYREMREMEASGLVEIQSHSLTHTWHFQGPEIVDFWHPGAATRSMGPVWMLWNKFPDRKPFYLVEASELEGRIPYGTPVYEHGKSLATITYFPDEAELEARLIDLAASKDTEFYRRTGWRDELYEAARKYRERHGIKGRYEGEQEHRERISNELSESKRRIEEGLGHPIEGICWPGGGVTKEVVQIAKRIGYTYFTLPTALRRTQASAYSEGMIPRIGSLPSVRLKGRDLGYPSARDFGYHLRGNNGHPWARWMFHCGRVKKLLLGPRDY